LRALFIAVGLFLAVIGLVFTIGLFLIVEPGTQGRFSHIATAGKLFLYKHALINTLSESESRALYRTSCTKRCHSTDVVEKTPRTAVEWEWIVDRMNTPERADLSRQQARGITEYLQRHFLSKVPTILPEQTMAFLRRHLWKSDFGEQDIYLDLIYIPTLHRALLPYLVAGRSAGLSTEPDAGPTFVLYINTHQGTVPPWDLTELAVMRDGQGREMRAIGWQVVYDDGQEHHRQGLLSFPAIDTSKLAEIEIEIDLPGMRKRTFLWPLPIPDFSPQSKDSTDV
jgi:hypothetical protein